MNKIMKLYKTLILSAVLLFTVASCDDFLDVNTDPNAATSVSPDVLFPPVLANIAANRAIEIFPSTAFFVNAWAPNGSTGVFINPDRYIISPFSTGNTWSNWYGSSMRNLTLMINAAETEEPIRPNVAAQARIMKAYLFFSLSMMWEEIPFTESQDPDQFPEPQFDDQRTVLYGVIDMLNESLDQIVVGGPAVEFGDLIYEGDMNLWIKFANSLKLRVYMYLRNKESVDAEIQAILAEDNLIRTNAEMAYIPFFDQADNANNMWKLHNQFGGFTGTANGVFYVYGGKTLVDKMNDLNDPRRNTYFAFCPPATCDEWLPEDFEGQAAGVSGGEGAAVYISQNVVRRDWPNRIVTPSEVYFYEAEFRATTGDLPGAHAAFIEGTRLNLEFLAPYTVRNPRGLNAADNPLNGISAAEIQDYIDGLPASFTSEAQALENIWTQSYIEIWDRSPENWSEWKRTKFPTLELPEQAQLGDIIRRYSYPPSEIASNPNTPQDPPLDTPMWFEN